jgi:uncharacterized protein (DUF427 family)
MTESVWDYPRPPRVERTDKLLRVEFAGQVLAETRRGVRVLETSHPPVYFFPPADVCLDLLHSDPVQTHCEWKGVARYFDVVVADRRAERAAFSYPQPTPGNEVLAGYLAFYARPMDGCYVDEERAEPQPGDFYSGWITSDLKGPFKGGPGSLGW